jgi:hypothetical protein
MLSTPRTTNALRQPPCWAMKVPAGTPKTDPTGTAEKITAVAAPTCSGRTSRAARPAPIDQKPPITMPTSARDATMTG